MQGRMTTKSTGESRVGCQASNLFIGRTRTLALSMVLNAHRPRPTHDISSPSCSSSYRSRRPPRQYSGLLSSKLDGYRHDDGNDIIADDASNDNNNNNNTSYGAIDYDHNDNEKDATIVELQYAHCYFLSVRQIALLDNELAQQPKVTLPSLQLCVYPRMPR